MIDEDLQVFRRVDLLHLQRRHDDMINPVLSHPIEELLIERTHAQTC